MLSDLKFVQGAISKKELIPTLSHFLIHEGRVTGYNGILALSSPISFDVECKPKAIPLIQAISKCNDVTVLAMTASNRLKVQSGKFRAYIDCIDSQYPDINPEGTEIQIDGEVLLKAFKKLSPFIGDDASRRWTNGVLLRGESAFATNNVCLVEHWIKQEVPFSANIPSNAVKEILRINEPPTHVQLSENSITFHFANERWIRSQLYSTEWPDLGAILDVENNPIPIPSDFFEGLEALRPFVGKLGAVYFQNGEMRTHLEDEGATYELQQFPFDGAYNVEMLRLLDGNAITIDFSKYPKPCLFFGDELRGAIIGMRL